MIRQTYFGYLLLKKLSHKNFHQSFQNMHFSYPVLKGFLCETLTDWLLFGRCFYNICIKGSIHHFCDGIDAKFYYKTQSWFSYFSIR